MRTKRGPTQAAERERLALLERGVEERIGPERYGLWFRGRTRFSWEAGEVVVGVQNRFYLDFLESKYAKIVSEAAAAAAGRAVKVRFVIDPELFRAARAAEAAAAAAPQTAPAAPRKEKAPQRPPDADADPPLPKKAPRKRRWHSLTEFVVGPCNRVAYASALAVVDNPGIDVNPLVLHGPVGTGKTHLLEGIYLELRQRHPEWRVLYVTSEDFTNRFVQAMRLGKLATFRRQFRDADALLVDDLHFLGSKRATQEEFLHTFDALHADGRQVVLTCDCHPRLNEQFLPELVDRLLGGAIWGVLPPDYETRAHLLRAKSGGRGTPPLSEEVVAFLSENLRGNVRELEGALNSLFHYAKVSGRKIDVTLAREVLGDLLRHTVRVVHLPDIDRVVCHLLHLNPGSLQSKHRSWAFSHPRMLAMYLARKHTAATHSEVGKYFGNRSHSTVVAAEKKVRRWVEDDETLALGNRQVRVRDLIERAERDLLR